MYNLYKEHCQNINEIPVNETNYRRNFNNNFNLHFHSPSSDICAKCDYFKLKISALQDDEQEKSRVTVQHELHLRKVEVAQNSLKKDAE